MSGLLASATAAKLRSGLYKIEHTYFLSVPNAATPTAWELKTIHDVTTNDIRKITDHGVMSREGYNFSVSDPGKLAFGQYKFVASNKDGFFSRGADVWEHSTTSYVAEPHECRVSRYSSIYITSWQILDGTYYTGEIERVEYKDANMTKPGHIVFFCAPVGLELLTGKTWGEDDFDELDLSSAGTFTGPLPEDN